MSDMKDTMLQAIEATLRQTGGSLRELPGEVAAYAAARAAHLATFVGREGFDDAWRIEQNNVIAFAKIEATREGIRLNDALGATVRTALLFAARVAARA